MDMVALTKFARQILRSQMCIPFEHLQRLVPGNGCNFHGVEVFFKQSAGGFVAQVVKVEVFDASASNGADESFFDGFCGHARKNLSVNGWWQ